MLARTVWLWPLRRRYAGAGELERVLPAVDHLPGPDEDPPTGRRGRLRTTWPYLVLTYTSLPTASENLPLRIFMFVTRVAGCPAKPSAGAAQACHSRRLSLGLVICFNCAHVMLAIEEWSDY